MERYTFTHETPMTLNHILGELRLPAAKEAAIRSAACRLHIPDTSVPTLAELHDVLNSAFASGWSCILGDRYFDSDGLAARRTSNVGGFQARLLLHDEVPEWK